MTLQVPSPEWNFDIKKKGEAAIRGFVQPLMVLRRLQRPIFTLPLKSFKFLSDSQSTFRPIVKYYPGAHKKCFSLE